MNGLLLLSMQVWRGLWAPPGHERAAGVWGGSSPAGCPAAVAPEAWRWLEQTAGDVGEQERCSGPGSHFPSVPARCQTGRVLPQQPGETMTMTLGLSVLKPWFRYGQHQVTCHCCVDDDTLNIDYLTTFHHHMTVFLSVMYSQQLGASVLFLLQPRCIIQICSTKTSEQFFYSTLEKLNAKWTQLLYATCMMCFYVAVSPFRWFSLSLSVTEAETNPPSLCSFFPFHLIFSSDGGRPEGPIYCT